MRKKLAFALALAMAVTSVPVNGLVGYAEEMTEDVEAGEALDEIISEDDFEGGVTKDILGRVDTEEAGEPVEQ